MNLKKSRHGLAFFFFILVGQIAPAQMVVSDPNALLALLNNLENGIQVLATMESVYDQATKTVEEVKGVGDRILNLYEETKAMQANLSQLGQNIMSGNWNAATNSINMIANSYAYIKDSLPTIGEIDYYGNKINLAEIFSDPLRFMGEDVIGNFAGYVENQYAFQQSQGWGSLRDVGLDFFNPNRRRFNSNVVLLMRDIDDFSKDMATNELRIQVGVKTWLQTQSERVQELVMAMEGKDPDGQPLRDAQGNEITLTPTQYDEIRNNLLAAQTESMNQFVRIYLDNIEKSQIQATVGGASEMYRTIANQALEVAIAIEAGASASYVRSLMRGFEGAGVTGFTGIMMAEDEYAYQDAWADAMRQAIVVPEARHRASEATPEPLDFDQDGLRRTENPEVRIDRSLNFNEQLRRL